MFTIITVGTPLKNGTTTPDMQHLKNAITIIFKNIKKRLNHIEVDCSTRDLQNKVILMLEKKPN